MVLYAIAVIQARWEKTSTYIIAMEMETRNQT